jgi:hypothetical protein
MEASSMDDAAVDIRWHLLPSRTWPTGLLQCRLSDKRERESAILSVRAPGGGEQSRPAGTSEQRYRASNLLRRESECCCRNGSDLLRRASEWCRNEKTEMSNNNARLRCEKKGDLGWQSKETSPKKLAYL